MLRADTRKKTQHRIQNLNDVKRQLILTECLHRRLDATRHSVDFGRAEQEVRALLRLDHLLAHLHALDAAQRVARLLEHRSTLRKAFLPRKHVPLAFLYIPVQVTIQRVQCL